jgi:hypothetical protein
MGWILPIAEIGATIGGGLLGGLLGGRQSSQEKQLLGQEAENAAFGGQIAQQALPGAVGGLEQAQNFWQTLMSGNTQASNRMLGPAISGIQGQAGQVAGNILNLSPRGGYSSRALADLPTNTMGQIINLRNQLFGMAPQELAAVSGQLGALGTSALAQSTSAGSTGLNFLAGKDERSIQTGGMVGQGLGQMLFALLNRQGGGGDGIDWDTMAQLANLGLDTSGGGPT